MYLLDPEEGQHRRHYIADVARGGWEGVRDAATYAGEATAGAGRATAAGASAATDWLANTRVAKGISSGTRRFRDESSDRLGYLWHGRQHSTGIESGIGQALAGVGLLALGFTAMYFLDPVAGERRRHVCRDKFLSGFGRMARSLERTGRDLWNRTTGMAHETRKSLSREDVDDRVLCERVRSGIGRCVSNVGAINVEARQGRITLSGPVLASEVDGLLKCAWSVRGVRELVNRLETFNSTEEFQRALPQRGGRPARAYTGPEFGSTANNNTFLRQPDVATRPAEGAASSVPFGCPTDTSFGGGTTPGANI
jgi:osmotically-inducible protein OsmY